MNYWETHDDYIVIRIPTFRGYRMTVINGVMLGCSAGLLALAAVGVPVAPMGFLLGVLMVSFANYVHGVWSAGSLPAIVEAAGQRVQEEVLELDEAQAIDEVTTVRQHDALSQHAKDLRVLIADLEAMDNADPSLGDAGLVSALTGVEHRKGESWSELLASAEPRNDGFMEGWMKSRTVPKAYQLHSMQEAARYGKSAEVVRANRNGDIERAAIEFNDMLHPDFKMH